MKRLLKVRESGWTPKGVASLPSLVSRVVLSYGGPPFPSPLITLAGAMTSSRPVVMMVNQAAGTTRSKTVHESLPREQGLMKINWQLSLTA